MKSRGKRKAAKIVLTVIAVLIVLIAALVAGGFILKGYDYGDRTEILSSDSPQPKKALVVYQPSLTPASCDVAYSIARGLNDSGYEVTLSNPGDHLPEDISAYAVVVLGSPNYGGSVADPLLKYVERVGDFSGKRVILFSTSGGISIIPELENLATLLHGTQPYSMVKFQFSATDENKAAAYQLGAEAAQP